MKLTPSGELLFDYAQEMLFLYEQSHSALKEQEIKMLSVGTIETLAIYFLPQLLELFKEVYPDIHIRIIPAAEKKIIQMLKEKEIDFGLILDFPCLIEGIESLHIEKTEMRIALSHSHSFAGKSKLSVEDLENEAFILTEEGCTYRIFLLEKMKKQAISHTISMELSSVETIKKAVENNGGIGFLPRFSLAERGGNSSLKTIPFHDRNMNFHSQ